MEPIQIGWLCRRNPNALGFIDDDGVMYLEERSERDWEFLNDHMVKAYDGDQNWNLTDHLPYVERAGL